MKYLIIAEKPSVATDLSKALAGKLGKFEKSGKSRDTQYYESENAAITSAVGHLVELKMPTGKNGKNLPWNFSALPAIPEKFELQPIEKTQGRLKHVLGLARKKEYEVIVNACDAGREGELIFQYIMEIGNIQKPVKRLWMSSMTAEAIIEAWNKLIEGEKMTHLKDAAKCRSEADWLVGLNSTRALTCFRSRHGGFNITAAGPAGFAIAFGLGYGGIMVAAFWGVFIWKEFKAAPQGTNMLLSLMFVFYLAGLALIIAAKPA